MGIYSTTGSMNVGMNEAYATPYGALQMALDAKQNDLALFESLIVRDIQEATAIANNDGYMLEEVQVLTENAISNAWDKVIALLGKIGAKIKAIFAKVITKLNMLFTKDNAALLKEHSKNFYGKDYSDLKIKNFRAIKIFVDKAGITGNGSNLCDVDVFKTIDPYKGIDGSDIETVRKNTLKVDNFLAKALGKTSGEYTPSEFREELDDRAWDTATTEIGLNSTQQNFITQILSGKKTISEIKKGQSDIEKSLRDLMREAEKEQKNNLEDKERNDEKDLTLAKINRHITEINNAQSACGTAFSAIIGITKAQIAQSRRVFMMCVNYTPKVESAMLEAVGAVAEEEVLEYFEDYED